MPGERMHALAAWRIRYSCMTSGNNWHSLLSCVGFWVSCPLLTWMLAVRARARYTCRTILVYTGMLISLIAYSAINL